jgi:hypothetical protein
LLVLEAAPGRATCERGYSTLSQPGLKPSEIHLPDRQTFAKKKHAVRVEKSESNAAETKNYQMARDERMNTRGDAVA